MAAKRRGSAQVEEDSPQVQAAALFVKRERPEIEEALAELDGTDITTEEGYQFLGGALKVIAGRFTALDEKRKSWVEPLKRVAADIDAEFRPVLKALKEAEERIKDRLGGRAVDVAEKKSGLLREAAALSAKGDEKGAKLKLAAAHATAVPVVEGVGVSAYWTGEVLDPALLPREYLMPDLKKLEAVTEATAGDPKIAGWRAFVASSVRTTRKGA